MPALVPEQVAHMPKQGNKADFDIEATYPNIAE